MKLSKLVYSVVFIFVLTFISVPSTQAHFSESPAQVASVDGVIEVYQIDRQAIKLNVLVEESIMLELFSASGTLVFSAEIPANATTFSINVSSLPVGQYSIIATTATESQTLKVGVTE